MEFLFELIQRKKGKDSYREILMKVVANGTAETFLKLVRIIKDEGLVKYGSVKRCIAVWTRLYNKKTVNTITEDTVNELYAALFDEGQCERNLASKKAKNVYWALWGKGVVCVEDTLHLMKKLMREGNAEEKCAVAYYTMGLDIPFYTTDLVEIFMENCAYTEEDLQILSILFCSYLRSTDLYATVGEELEELEFGNLRSGSEYFKKQGAKPLSYNKYFQSKEQAEEHYARLQALLEHLSKKKLRYENDIFPTSKLILSRSEVILRMLLIAYMLEDQEKFKRLRDMEGEVDSDYRYVYAHILGIEKV